MRILIIGGTSFMGPYVVRRLSEQGHEITVLHRGRTHMELPAGVQEILGERRPLAHMAATLQRLAPDVVLDMIPALEQDAQEVMTTFSGMARRIVAISSQDVYRAFGRVNGKESGPPDLLPITEDAPLRENLYPYRGFHLRDKDTPQFVTDNYDKILVERLVMGEPNLPGTVLRLPAVYGPGDRQHRFFNYLKRMDDKRPAILLDEGVAQWRWTHGYMENVAAAIVLAVTDERVSRHIYNVGEIYTPTLTERVSNLGQIAGWRGQVVIVPRDRLPTQLVADIDTSQDIVVDTSRIRKELGYAEIVPYDEGLRRTIAWERAHPPQEVDPEQFDYATEDAVLKEMGK